MGERDLVGSAMHTQRPEIQGRRTYLRVLSGQLRHIEPLPKAERFGVTLLAHHPQVAKVRSL